MLDKIIFYTKRFFNCIDAPGRNESFDEYVNKVININSNKDHTYLFGYLIYRNENSLYDSFEELYKIYWNDTNKKLSIETYNYTLDYIIKNLNSKFEYNIDEDEYGEFLYIYKK